LKSSEAFLHRVILRLQCDTIARHQYTIFVEDAQEYAPVFTSCRRRFCKLKIETNSLDPNKKCRERAKFLLEPPYPARPGRSASVLRRPPFSYSPEAAVGNPWMREINPRTMAASSETHFREQGFVNNARLPQQG
jgi:hypothetical protein